MSPQVGSQTPSPEAPSDATAELSISSADALELKLEPESKSLKGADPTIIDHGGSQLSSVTLG